MSRLLARMYAGTTLAAPGLFGLWNGQTRQPGLDRGGHAQPVMVPVMFTDTLWYNTQGEWLGQGDMDANDVRNIAKGLMAGEVFVIVRRRDLDASGFRAGGNKLERPALTSTMDCVVRPATVWLIQENDAGRVKVDGVTLTTAKRGWASQNLLDD